jgi:DNA recombination protein RmuC
MVITTVAVGVLAVLVTAGVCALVVAAHVRAVVADTTGAATRHADERGRSVDRRLEALHGELGRITGVVADLRAERAHQHGEFLARLADTTRATTELHRTARGLREALASPKARGQWGERTAEDILRRAGFVEGVTHVRQRATSAGSIPDITFLLPGDLVLHMDVKFPAANYLRAIEATGPADRAAAEKAFLGDVRQRIRELAGRGYIDAATTVDYVLLFIPNESIYGFVHDRAPGMVDDALARRVVLCSPFTLFAVLAVIRQAVDALRLEKASDEIIACLAAFGDEWDRFCDQLDRVDKQLDTAARGFDALAGVRRRQLQRKVDAARQLGEERRRPPPLPPEGRAVRGPSSARPPSVAPAGPDGFSRAPPIGRRS